MPLSNFSDFFFEDGRTVVVNSDDEPMDFCEEIKIDSEKIDISSTEREVHAKVICEDGFHGEWEGPREELLLHPLNALVSCGLSLPCTQDNALTLSEILMETEKSADKVYRHTALGWYKHCGKNCFLGSKVVGSDIKSVFAYPEKVESSGTFKDWQEAIRPIIKGRPKIQLALAVGASAMFVPILAEAGLLSGSIIVAFIGKTSQSKTTMLRTISGIYGRGEIGYAIESFNDTANYTVETLSGKRGFLHCIDEISVKDDVSDTLYFFSQGKSRGRCNGDGSLKKIRKWSTTIVLTGERNIFKEQTNGARGLKARVIPINLLWTDTPDDAKMVEKFNTDHYGVAYEPLAKFLLNFPRERLLDSYRRIYEEFYKLFGVADGVEDRLIKMYAAIFLAAKIMAKAWKLEVNLEVVKQLLLEIHQNNEAVKDPAHELYEAIKSQLLEKADKIIDGNSNNCLCSNPIGIKGKHFQLPVLWLKTSLLDTMIRKAGEQNVDLARDQLFESGYLYRPYGRKKVSKTLAGIPVHCDCLALTSTTGPKKSKTKKKRFRKKETRRKGSQLANLLAPDDED